MKLFFTYFFITLSFYLLTFVLFCITPMVWAYFVFVLLWSVATFYKRTKKEKDDEFKISDIGKLFSQFKDSRTKNKKEQSGIVSPSAIVGAKEVCLPAAAPVRKAKEKTEGVNWLWIFFLCTPCIALLLCEGVFFSLTYVILLLILNDVKMILPRRKIVPAVIQKRFRYHPILN